MPRLISVDRQPSGRRAESEEGRAICGLWGVSRNIRYLEQIQDPSFSYIDIARAVGDNPSAGMQLQYTHIFIQSLASMPSVVRSRRFH